MKKKFDVEAVEAKLLAYIANYCNENIPVEEAGSFFVKLTIDLLRVMIEYSDHVEENELIFLYEFDAIQQEINKVIDEAMEKKRKEYDARIDGGEDGEEKGS